MSVNRKVRVPVGGLANTLMSSLLPLRGHYSSGGFPGPSVRRASTSGSWSTAAERLTSQVRSRIRCTRTLRDRVRLVSHTRFYTEPRGVSTLADTCAPPPHAGESSYALANPVCKFL